MNLPIISRITKPTCINTSLLNVTAITAIVLVLLGLKNGPFKSVVQFDSPISKTFLGIGSSILIMDLVWATALCKNKFQPNPELTRSREEQAKVTSPSPLSSSTPVINPADRQAMLSPEYQPFPCNALPKDSFFLSTAEKSHLPPKEIFTNPNLRFAVRKMLALPTASQNGITILTMVKGTSFGTYCHQNRISTQAYLAP